MPVYLSSRSFGLFDPAVDVWLVIGLLIVSLVALSMRKGK